MSEAIASILATSSDTARMRLLAESGDGNVNAEILQQFEALFLQQMLKSMRVASLGNGLFQSDQTEFYRDLYDQQIATDLAAKEVLGISQLINRQLGLGEATTQEVESDAISEVQDVFLGTEHKTNSIDNAGAEARFDSANSANSAAQVTLESAIANISEQYASIESLSEIRRPPFEPVPDPKKNLAFKPVSPEHFVEHAYEFSRPAARRLGVDAEVIIAIAALETGWGAHLPSDGEVLSNNYFGIKADNRWEGPSVVSDTLEFGNGVFDKLKQSFRAYDDLGASFDDFAEFLLGNERYAKALEFAHDAKQFVQEMQRAGYATDPKYADKILNVLKSEAFAVIRK